MWCQIWSSSHGDNKACHLSQSTICIDNTGRWSTCYKRKVLTSIYYKNATFFTAIIKKSKLAIKTANLYKNNYSHDDKPWPANYSKTVKSIRLTRVSSGSTPNVLDEKKSKFIGCTTHMGKQPSLTCDLMQGQALVEATLCEVGSSPCTFNRSGQLSLHLDTLYC